MAEAPQALLEARHRSALDAVRTALTADSAYQVVSAESAAPMLRHCSVIWRRQIRTADRERTVDVGLPPYFPDEPPIACVTEWDDLVPRNPHVLLGGLLCIIPDSAAIDSNDPTGLVSYVFNGAEEVLKGTDPSDFQDEFSYYWDRTTTDAKTVVMVEPAGKLGSTFPAMSTERLVFVASSVEKLNRWLSNWIGKPFELKNQELGIAIRLDKPLLPQEYPETLADLVSLAETNDTTAAHLLKAHIAKNDDRALALLLQKEGSGLALAGVAFDGLGLSHIRTRDLSRGFRPGKTPPGLLVKRAAQRIACTPIKRNSVLKVDQERIHMRGGDGRDLSQKSVLVIGCGSLGGYVAHLLSRTGVGRIVIIDKERLAWANLGRHILGASSVDEWKAEVLAKELTQQMPHLDITGIAKDWREHLADEPELLNSYDLVLSTVADWRCEAPLNALARQTPMPLVLFGWLEPYAVAGHCLVVGQEGGCLQCTANTFGQFNQRVSNFDGTTLSKDPGGCTHYQQYGPIAVMPVATLIASTAVDSLVDGSRDSHLHTWISSEEHLRAVGASLADTWLPEVNTMGYSRTFRKPWKSSASCALCSRTNS